MRFLPARPIALSLLLVCAACANHAASVARAFQPPPIILHEPAPDVPEAYRPYLGVWEFDGVFPGHNHPFQNIIAVTRIDRDGAVCLRQLMNTPVTFGGPRWFSHFRSARIDEHGIRWNAGIVDEWLVRDDDLGPALAAYISQKAPAGQRSFDGARQISQYARADTLGNPDLQVQRLPADKTPPASAPCED